MTEIEKLIEKLEAERAALIAGREKFFAAHDVRLLRGHDSEVTRTLRREIDEFTRAHNVALTSVNSRIAAAKMREKETT